MPERLTPEREAWLRTVRDRPFDWPNDFAAVLFAELDAVRRERDEADALCAQLRRDLEEARRE